MAPTVIKEPKIQLKGHAYWCRYVTWSPDGDLIATASADNFVRVFQCDGTEAFKYVIVVPSHVPPHALFAQLFRSQCFSPIMASCCNSCSVEQGQASGLGVGVRLLVHAEAQGALPFPFP